MNDQKPEQQPEAQKQDKSEGHLRLIEVTQHWTANALHVRLGTRNSVIKRLRPYLGSIGESFASVVPTPTSKTLKVCSVATSPKHNFSRSRFV